MLKTTFIIMVGIFAVGVAQAATITSANDLLFVVGEGANQSNLIIDFNDGETSESFAWGYRYDGVASGADMLLAIANEDANLSLVATGDGDSGFFMTSLSYLAEGIAHTRASDFVVNNVSWGYYLAGGFAGDDQPGVAGGNDIVISGGGDSLPSSWDVAQVGASRTGFGDTGRLLVDGSWDAWSFGAFDPMSFAHLAGPGPEAPFAAVPEPSSSLFVLSALGLLLRRRRGL